MAANASFEQAAAFQLSALCHDCCINAGFTAFVLCALSDLLVESTAMEGGSADGGGGGEEATTPPDGGACEGEPTPPQGLSSAFPEVLADATDGSTDGAGGGEAAIPRGGGAGEGEPTPPPDGGAGGWQATLPHDLPPGA